MQRKHSVIISAAMILLAVVAWPDLSQPAQAHDAREHPAAACCCQVGGALFPATEDPDVARAYATAHIVAAYIQENPNIATQNVAQFSGQVYDALD